MSPLRRLRPASAVLALAAGGLAVGALAQISVRPDDPSGFSIRERRVRVMHASTPEVPGTSMNLQQADPWLAYERGRSYFFHEWGKDEGVFAVATSRIAAATTTSCGMCHNLPFRSPGSGGNTAEPVGYGRNTPHLFGAGLIEMIGQQMRAEAMASFDRNGNGFLDVPAETAGQRLVIEATPGVKVDFGSLADDNGDGLPDLNPTLQVTFVDAQGQAVRPAPGSRRVRLTDAGVVGFDLGFGVFASSAGDHQFPSLRIFQNGVLRTVMGITADDPTCLQGLGKDAERAPQQVWARRSNAGSLQPNPPLLPSTLEALSRMQPGTPGTMSEGEVDLIEWYLLNHPAPAVGPQDAETRRGRQLLAEMGCESCHVPDWQIQAADARKGLAGDRRFFNLAVTWNDEKSRFEGRVEDLSRVAAGPGGQKLRQPRYGAFKVEGLYSDLRHHDLGERFTERYYYQGKLIPLSRFRTQPLWGVGSTAPYGHDGRSPGLDDVIRRHGGEAESSAEAYRQASEADRSALIAFLRSLVLYQPDVLPTDLDGDGKVAEAWTRSGHEMGPERFFPELLFAHTPVYRGWTDGPDGDRFFSYLLNNQAEAYGETLTALADQNGDGLPDFEQAAPPLPAAGARPSGGRR